MNALGFMLFWIGVIGVGILITGTVIWVLAYYIHSFWEDGEYGLLIFLLIIIFSFIMVLGFGLMT